MSQFLLRLFGKTLKIIALIIFVVGFLTGGFLIGRSTNLFPKIDPASATSLTATWPGKFLNNLIPDSLPALAQAGSPYQSIIGNVIISRIYAAPSTTATPNGGLMIDASPLDNVLLSMGNHNNGTNSYSWLQSRHPSSPTYLSLALNPNGGNVGVGTTSPGATVDVRGNLIQRSSVNSLITNSLGWTGNAGGYHDIYYDGTARIHLSAGPASGNSYITNGNLGIGTTNPGALLSFGNNLNRNLNFYEDGSNGLSFEVRGGMYEFTSRGSVPINFATKPYASAYATAPTYLMTLLTNGNVGIGTTNPSEALEIWKVVGQKAALKVTSNQSSGEVSMISTDDNLKLINYTTSGTGTNYANIQFFTNGDTTTPKLQISKNGNVGIGTTSPGSPLTVTGDITSSAPGTGNWNSGVLNLKDTSNNVTWQIDNRGSLDTGSQNKLKFLYYDGANWYERMSINTSGNTYIAGCLYYNGGTLGSCLSDIRLKKNINSFNLGLPQILGLKPVTYQFNGLGGTTDDGKTKTGLIAQDVEKVAPGLVSTQQVKLNPNDKTETEVKAVDYNALTFTLINAVKEQQKEIESLRQEIEELKKK